ncbi:MAG TPA: helix-turn-helix domain-containing protein [Acidimicrobiales bacterium]|nr:helix-turn-helix domain-containing protein [Acidimicrobiales bacterium]
MAHHHYDDIVIVTADAAPAHTDALAASGYRALLVTARHTIYTRTTSPSPQPAPEAAPAPAQRRRGLTVTQAAGILGISRSAAYDMIHTGALPSVRLGRRIVVPDTALDDLLAARPTLAAS